MVKTQVIEIEQNLEIEVVTTDEQMPGAWDEAVNVVVDCLLDLLRFKAQSFNHSDEGGKNGLD